MEWTNERLALLGFLQQPGIGSRRLRALKARCGSLQAAWNASPTIWREAEVPDKIVSELVTRRQRIVLDELPRALERDSIRLVTPTDTDYPVLFHQMADRPEGLFVRGTIQHLPWIAFVGSRTMPSYGQHCIDVLIPRLRQTH